MTKDKDGHSGFVICFVWLTLMVTIASMVFIKYQFEYRNNLIQSALARGQCDEQKEKKRSYK